MLSATGDAALSGCRGSYFCPAPVKITSGLAGKRSQVEVFSPEAGAGQPAGWPPEMAANL
jgi:hypothetical protein